MIAKYFSIFLLGLSTPAFGDILCEYSFISKSEEIICAHTELRALDKKLNELYSAAFRIDSDSQGLKREQLHWLSHERDKCDSHQCMYEVYENRIFFLSQRIEANKKLNDAPLTKTEVSKVCGELAAIASNKALPKYKIAGIDAATIRNSIKGLWGSSEDLERVGGGIGLGNIQEIYNIKVSNTARARKFVRYLTGGSCYSDKIFPLDYLTRHDKEYNGRIAVSDAGDELMSASWGAGEFPIYYQQRNYIITGGTTGPSVISHIQSDGQILPLCTISKTSTSWVVADDKSTDKGFCAAIASGSIKPQPWKNKYTAAEVQDAELASMSEMRGLYDVNLLLLPIQIKEGESPQDFVKFSQDSGAGCGSHNEWLRRTTLDKNTLRIRFDDKALVNQAAERVDIYLHNDHYYIGYFAARDAILYQLNNDTLSKTCGFEEKPAFRVDRFF